MNKTIIILSLLSLFGCQTPTEVGLVIPEPIISHQNNYTCAEALEAPGIYAGRIDGKELEDYEAVVDCYCHNGEYTFTECKIGLISNQIVQYPLPESFDICKPLVATCNQ